MQSHMAAPCNPCSRQEFERVTQMPSVLKAMKQCGKICRELNSPELFQQTDEQKKALRQEFDRIKRSLPMFVYQGVFQQAKRVQKDVQLNGLFMVDFDHINPHETLEAWARRLGLDPTDRTALWQHLNSQLGVLMVHITPSHFGLRLVAKAQIEGDLSWNQHRLASALGMEPDEACKDASRCSFAVGREEILYINPEMFEYDNKAYDEKYGPLYRTGRAASVGNGNAVPANGCVVAPGMAAQADTVAGSPAVEAAQLAGRLAGPDGDPAAMGLTYGGLPLADIIAQWWKMYGGEPVEGQRNVRLQQLASHLRYITDNRPEALLAVLPSYGLTTQEMQGLVQRACEYRFHSSIPKKLQAVLDSLQQIELPDGQPTEELYNRLLDSFTRRLSGLKLPPVLRAVAAGVEPCVKMGALLASLPMFFTLLSRVRFRHYDGSESRLSGMTFIIGPAASGKSFIRELDAILMECLRAEDKSGRELEELYKESKELNKNKAEQMRRPAPCVRILPSTISNAKLAERLRNAFDPALRLFLHCYTMETELATALRAAKGGSWIEKGDLYCKSFHNELWGLDYANDQAINGEVQVNLNLVVSGTEDAFDRLIPTATILSGLPTRIMYFPMPDSRYKMLDPKATRRTENQVTEMRDCAYALCHSGGWVEAGALTKAMYQWCSRMANRARLEDDTELDDLRKRTALIGIRAGIVFAILQQWRAYSQGQPLKIGQEAIRFAELVADFCLSSQYAKFAHRMRQQKQKAREYSGARQDHSKAATLYAALKERFETKDLVLLADSPQTASNFISKWTRRGIIKKLDRGCYEKILTEI